MLDSASVSEYGGSGDNQGGEKDKVFITESLLSSSILYESGILIASRLQFPKMWNNLLLHIRQDSSQ